MHYLAGLYYCRAMVICRTFDEVVAALGGQKEVQRLTGRNSNNFGGYRTKQLFPPEVYERMKKALTARGFTASPELWRIEDPEHTPPKSLRKKSKLQRKCT